MLEKVEQRFIGLIPAYNENSRIKAVVTGVKNYVDEVVVVSDGSVDGTAQEALAAGAIVLSHKKNLGKGAALKAGFDYILKRYPRAEGVITIDGDGQHDSDEIPKFLDIFEESRPDLILGERVIKRKEMPTLRRLGNFLLSGLISLRAGRKIIDSQSGFRFFSRRFLESLNLHSAGYGIETELLLAVNKNKFSLKIIPVTVNYINKNQINFLKDCRIIGSIIKELIN